VLPQAETSSQTARKSPKRTLVEKVLPIAGLVALLVHGGCKSEVVEIREPGSKLVVSQPLKRDATVTRDYVCQIHSKRHIELRSLERGYVQRVAVNEGQRLEQGQLMFEILPVIYRAELQRAQAEVTAAQVEYENTRRLADNDVVSESQLALAKASYERARADVDVARAHLSFTQVKAPFSGIMDRLHVREGSLVEEGDLLTTLSDNSHMWAYFNVPEAEYLDYVVETSGDRDTTVELLMANNRVFDQPGKVAVIEADFDNTTGTIPFRADFPNPKGLLRHGQTGNVLMKRPIRDALLVPQKATFEILDHTYVFVVGDDDVVEQRHISIREELEDLFVVDEGLAANEKIVIEGLRQVRDGQQIAYEYEEPGRVVAELKLPAE
jgi:membrane fusion protein (multidrug efflux system)